MVPQSDAGLKRRLRGGEEKTKRRRGGKEEDEQELYGVGKVGVKNARFKY
jgi:hypothetical protein